MQLHAQRAQRDYSIEANGEIEMGAWLDVAAWSSPDLRRYWRLVKSVRVYMSLRQYESENPEFMNRLAGIKAMFTNEDISDWITFYDDPEDETPDQREEATKDIYRRTWNYPAFINHRLFVPPQYAFPYGPQTTGTFPAANIPTVPPLHDFRLYQFNSDGDITRSILPKFSLPLGQIGMETPVDVADLPGAAPGSLSVYDRGMFRLASWSGNIVVPPQCDIGFVIGPALAVQQGQAGTRTSLVVIDGEQYMASDFEDLIPYLNAPLT